MNREAHIKHFKDMPRRLQDVRIIRLVAAFIGKSCDLAEAIQLWNEGSESIEEALRNLFVSHFSYDQSESRRMELTTENMKLMADKSTLESEVARLRGLIEQHYRDNDGHNHCWRNNHRLWEGIGLKAKELNLPPRDEAEAGCKAFWDEMYSNPNRWSDFIPIANLNRTDGTCRTCGTQVPEANLNKFYCSESCREIGWRKHHLQGNNDGLE